MPINKAVLAGMRAASTLKPDAARAYRIQRTVEGVFGRLAPDLGQLASDLPRCRIEDSAARMPDGYEVPLRIFTPVPEQFVIENGAAVAEPPRGTILFFHGGGWVSGDVPLYTEACIRMAGTLWRRVVSVEYRRAPEWRFPHAADDCYEVARQLYAGELAPMLAEDPARVTLFGDSAGGNLAAVVSLMARERGAFLPAAQILLYPVVGNDYDPATSPFASVRENGEDYLLTAADLRDYLAMYQSSAADLANPHFAPLMAPDLSHQPRTLVISAEYCPLRDEDEAYARRLAEAGNDVQCYRVLDGVHGYLLHPHVHGLVRTTYQLAAHFLDGTELAREGEATWLEIPGIA